jgi:putative ABC transport system permease protein
MNSTIARRPSVWRLAWQQTTRDFRAGELRLLLVAVLLAVAALSAVGFFADRLESGLTRDAAQMLGGDAVVASDQPTPPAFVAEATQLGLTTAATAVFPSMGRAPEALGGATRLVSVKAVSDAYPLRGRLSLDSGPGTPEEKVAAAPQPGKVWVDRQLLEALGLKVGDSLLLGD